MKRRITTGSIPNCCTVRLETRFEFPERIEAGFGKTSGTMIVIDDFIHESNPIICPVNCEATDVNVAEENFGTFHLFIDFLEHM